MTVRGYEEPRLPVVDDGTSLEPVTELGQWHEWPWCHSGIVPALGRNGCGHRARHADLDHTTKYRHGGKTSRKHLRPSCPRHHRVKDLDGTGWTAKVNDDGSTTITDPTGHTYRVWPHDYRGP